MDLNNHTYFCRVRQSVTNLYNYWFFMRLTPSTLEIWYSLKQKTEVNVKSRGLIHQIGKQYQEYTLLSHAEKIFNKYHCTIKRLMNEKSRWVNQAMRAQWASYYHVNLLTSGSINSTFSTFIYFRNDNFNLHQILSRNIASGLSHWETGNVWTFVKYMYHYILISLFKTIR